MSTTTETRTISVAHSPDSDDAFMFYALATNKLDTGDIHFTHVLKDIQSLNEMARAGVYDVTAVSFHAFAYIADKYALLPHGASIGLPLPMGGNAIRRHLGPEMMSKVSRCLREGIRYSLEHREDALRYAMQFARDMDTDTADRFVALWVNDLTLDYTERGREAV